MSLKISLFLDMKPYLLIGLYLFPLLFGVYLINHFSPSPTLAQTPYSSTIIAFEFATSHTDIENALGTLSLLDIKNLDKLNYVDFGFMFVYCLCLFSFLLISKKIDSPKAYIPGSVLIGIILISDIIETISLLKISALHQKSALPELFTSQLTILHFSTWSKWIGLALCFVLFACILRKRNAFSKGMAFLLCVPFLLAFPAFFGGPQFKDIFATSIFGAFGILIVYCLIYKTQRSSKKI